MVFSGVFKKGVSKWVTSDEKPPLEWFYLYPSKGREDDRVAR